MIVTVALRGAMAALVLAIASARAQTETPSTPPKTFFTGRDGSIAAAMLAASAGVSVFDVRIARFFRDTALSHVRTGQRLDDIFTKINESTLTVGSLAVYAIAKLAGDRTVADVAIHSAEAVAAASLTSQVIRGPLGRTRPRNTDPAYSDQYDFHAFKGFGRFENRAFPSIHSSSGFAAASALVAEVQRRRPSAAWAVAVPAYALALTPGLSRMYLGQHWASDVVAGALLGSFYGWRIVEYAHDHPTTRIDRAFLGPVDKLGMRKLEPSFSVGWSVRF